MEPEKCRNEALDWPCHQGARRRDVFALIVSRRGAVNHKTGFYCSRFCGSHATPVPIGAANPCLFTRRA